MKSIEVKGSLREEVGKNSTKKARKEEMIPCALYGQGRNINFQVHELAVKDLVYTANAYIVELVIEGTTYQAAMQEIQFHPVTDKVLHIDFFEIAEGKSVVMRVPVQFEGVPAGVLKGGKLVKRKRYLKVRGLVKDLPDTITIDVTKLTIGKTIKISEVVRENLEMLDAAEDVIVMVKTARGVKAEAEEEEGGEAATE
ncbi:MAG: 50S ribosomal protein L25/general stress protein Ctc [Bacteroidales bacterium]